MNSKSSFSTHYGPWALITGAAMGLGAEFSRQLAERGLNIILVDIDEDALHTATEMIAAQTGVQTHPLVCDLSSGTDLSALTKATQDFEIGLLVNNAGISAIGHFLDIPLEKHLQIFEVNARAPLVLAHHFGAKMRSRGRGGIIFVSSGAATPGTSYVSVYSATKAFDLNLGEALWDELRPFGVDVLATIVGATDTPGWRDENPHPEAKVWPPIMRAADTVRETLDAIGKRPSFVPGIQNRLAAFLTTRLISRPSAVRVLANRMRDRYEKTR